METPEVALTAMAQDTSRIDTMDNTVTITQFLRRPVKLEHFVLKPGIKFLQQTVTTQPQTPIRSYDLPYAVLDRGGKIPKIQNHQYFKANIRVKLTLNTNPFVAGRFYLTYSPYEKAIVQSRQQQWASRAGVTAYPGVEIDAQLNNSVEMVIPFPSYKEAYVLTGEPENFVTLYLFALTDITGQKDSTGPIDITIFAWFEDIILNMPTLKTVQDKAQSLPPAIASVSAQDKKRLRIGRQLEKLKASDPASYSRALSLLRLREVDLQVQAEATTQGPIGTISGAVSGVADIVGKIPIPIVSEIANGVGWIADIVGGIANIFGWSRPNSYTQVAPLQNVPGKFYTHTMAEDQSVSLALSNKNELTQPNNIFPSAVDEMSLAFVCANPAVKAIFPWVSTTNAGELETTTPIGLLPVGIGCFTSESLATTDTVKTRESLSMPYMAKTENQANKWCNQDPLVNYKIFQMFKQSIPSEVYEADSKYTMDGTGCVSTICAAKPAYLQATGVVSRTILDTAPCEYVSQLFQYWRATICFKISVVKTAFHTGRLEIFFDPGMYITKGTSIEPDLSKYRDVDTTNNYRYIMDLTNDTEITIRIPYISEKVALTTKGYNVGYRQANIDDVANSIFGSLIIRPLTNLMAPATVADHVDVVVWKWAEDVVLMGPVNAGNVDSAIYGVTHSGNNVDIEFDDLNQSIIDAMTFVPPKTTMKSVEFQINIGNVANGNVITLFPSTNVEQNNMEACGNIAGERIVNLRPLLRAFRDWHTYPKTTKVTIDLQEESTKIDYMSYLSYMYRFFRGGVRYKAIVETEGKTRSWLHPGKTQSTTQAPSHLTFNAVNPVHEINIPYYSQYRKLPISSTDNLLNVTIQTDKETDIQVLRAGNDDLTYGWLMGTPQLMAGPATVTWQTYTRTKSEPVVPNSPGHANPKYINPNGNSACGATPVASENDIPNPYAVYRGKREAGGIDIPDNWQGDNLLSVELQISNPINQFFTNTSTQFPESVIKELEKDHKILRAMLINWQCNEDQAIGRSFCFLYRSYIFMQHWNQLLDYVGKPRMDKPCWADQGICYDANQLRLDITNSELGLMDLYANKEDFDYLKIVIPSFAINAKNFYRKWCNIGIKWAPLDECPDAPDTSYKPPCRD